MKNPLTWCPHCKKPHDNPIIGFSREVIKMRLDRLGWSVKKTLTTPIRTYSKIGKTNKGKTQ